jgi:hypothetical protein
MENLLTVMRDGQVILAIETGDIVLSPENLEERQYAFDLY